MGFADFLHEAARLEVEERLSVVNKTFTDAVIVGPRPGGWATGALANARTIADDETLDLAPGSADLVIHALGLHAANDPVGQMIQCRRALRPDGLFLATLWGGQTLMELRHALTAAETALFGGLSPRVNPMADLRDLGDLLARAGLALPVADMVPLPVTYGAITSLYSDLRAMGETNVMTARDRRPLSRRFWARVASEYQALATADDRLPARFDLMVLTGWAPDASQPEPLRPGSAAARLADALGTTEHKTGDKTGR